MSATTDGQNAHVGSADNTKKFWVTHSVELEDVESKIANKETVISSFSCRSDPRPIIFTFSLSFGGLVDDHLTWEVRPTHPIQLISTDTVLRTDGGEVLTAEQHDRAIAYSSGDDNFLDLGLVLANNGFYALGPSSKGKWRISIEIEYKHGSPIGNPPTENFSRIRLQDDLLALLKSSKNADVTFCFEERKIAAHKAILSARAPYFANMFASGMAEVSSNEVRVKDVESGVFEGILEYLYSGAAPANMPEIGLELLVAADKYGLDELKNMCEAGVGDRLTAAKAVDVVIVADKVNCASLYDKAVVVLRNSFDSLEEESSKKLMENPKLLFSLAAVFSKM